MPHRAVRLTHRHEEVDRKVYRTVLTLPPTAQTNPLPNLHEQMLNTETMVFQLNAHIVVHIVNAALVYKQ